MTHCVHISSSKKRERMEVEDTPVPIVDTTQKLHVPFPLTSHWLKFSHMTTPGCKGFWQI